MATNFAPYANLRFLWIAPGTITNFRAGVPAAGPSVVVEAFVKGTAASPQELASIKPQSRLLEGYITRFATVPAQGNWLAAASAFSWTSTGLAPTGLLPGVEGRALLGTLESLPTIAAGGLQGKATIVGLMEPFGPGGIGAELRSALGDKIRLSLEVVS
jgi:hypothetical protein